MENNFNRDDILNKVKNRLDEEFEEFKDILFISDSNKVAMDYTVKNKGIEFKIHLLINLSEFLDN